MYIQLEEFLVLEEILNLRKFVIHKKDEFQRTKVLNTNHPNGLVNDDYRKSTVLYDLATLGTMFQKKILSYLPAISNQLMLKPFIVSRVELQLTRSGHDEYFKAHLDNGQRKTSSRYLTFVYYFYKEPKSFFGGDLRLYEYKEYGGQRLFTGHNVNISPKQNSLVVFPSNTLHEVLPVYATENKFIDGRFTLNGWIHRD